MSVKTSTFPTQIFNGITSNHPSREDDINPNFDDYDQLIAELIATQGSLITLLGVTNLLADGSIPLTANWDAGAFKITALQLESDIATGTAPLIVASTTVVTNLNAEFVNGIDGADIIERGGGKPFTGRQQFKSVFQEWEDVFDEPTIIFDLDLSNKFRTNLAGNRILTLSNSVGNLAQAFIIKLTQDLTGSRTVTWFGTISWAGGSEPTLTTTGLKADLFVFIRTGLDFYDGFIVGQDV